jgi:hypothetical protein
METKANTPFYADKSFLLVVLTPILLFAGKKLGISLNVEEIAGLIAAVVAFVAGNKWKSAAVTIAEIKAESAQAASAEPAPSAAAALEEAAK